MCGKSEPRVLWFTPDKPERISVGRHRITERLEEIGYRVTLRGTTIETVLSAVWHRGRYDAVIGTTRAGTMAGMVLSALGGPPLIIDHVDPIRQFETTHPWWVAVPVRWLERIAFAVAAHVLYVYAEEHDRVSQFAESVSNTDLPVEYDRFADPPTERVVTAHERLSSLEGRTLIYVGGLEPVYHISELLDAMSVLSAWTLVVLGTGSLEPEVRRAATEQSNVVYLGTVPHEDVPGYLHAADVGVCLVDDPHTLKILEYGAAGLPVVQLAGRAESRLDGLVTFCDPTPADIARAVRSAASSPTSEELRAFARQFDVTTVADDYANAIETVTSTSPRTAE
ncbi:glycosyltransferase [Halocatena salina]|uniref:Glycosyltransferase n=1 Tax=Halocatena salina TaxID=2934340 RepID=A0A8U0A2B4_9EURY|nr:glycosyltransferase [Halocatena salina]UPM42578.1 glycosyltransferase [Halocatena salina]